MEILFTIPLLKIPLIFRLKRNCNFSFPFSYFYVYFVSKIIRNAFVIHLLIKEAVLLFFIAALGFAILIVLDQRFCIRTGFAYYF
jgi:hypothetical protein